MIVHAACGPDRPDAGRGKEGDNRLDTVRKIGDDPIAQGDALITQSRGKGRDLAAQLRPGELVVAAVLVDLDDRDAVGRPVTKDLVDEVQLRPREPDRARHRVIGEHRVTRAGREDVEVVPYAAPESGQVIDRPAQQRAVVGEARTGAVLDEASERGDPGRLDSGWIGRPDGGAHDVQYVVARRPTPISSDRRPEWRRRTPDQPRGTPARHRRRR